MRKIPFSAVLIAGIAALVAASGIASGAPAQSFNIDAKVCIGGGPAIPLTLSCTGAQVLTLDSTPDVSTGVLLPKGNRLTLTFAWTGPGWRIASDTDYATAGFTNAWASGSQALVGRILSRIDLLCDGAEDQFSENTDPNAATGNGEQIYWRGAWSTTSGPGDIVNGFATAKGHLDETYLDQGLPGFGYSLVARSRADVSGIFLFAGTGSESLLTPSNVVPLNFVTLHPTYAGAGTHVAVTLLAGAASPPSKQLLCLQSPQNSVSTINGVVGAVNPVGNPTTASGAGVYTRWFTALSAADFVDNTQEFMILADHRTIGAGTHTDADADGLELCSTAGASRPCEASEAASGTCGAGTALGAVAVPAYDSDCDGLQDGIETSLGTCPSATFNYNTGATGGTAVSGTWAPPVLTDCATVTDPADTDADGRTDLEEVIGPANSLTDPKSTNTDGDAVGDGGLVIKTGTGVHTGNKLRVSIPKDAIDNAGAKVFEGDNCPNIANTGQLNSDSGRPTAGDRTNPTEDAFGDACDTDDDNDFYNDLIENGTSPRCEIGSPEVTPTSGTLPLNPDSDGNVETGDGALDGRECQDNADPTVNSSYPLIPGAGDPSDADGLASAPGSVSEGQGSQDWEGFMNTFNIALTPAGTTCGVGSLCDTDGDGFDGNADDDSDSDGLKDGDETFYWGTSPAQKDSDRDGCNDNVEVISTDTDGAPGGTFGIDFDDLVAVILSYGKARGDVGYNKNVNFDHKKTSTNPALTTEQRVNFPDLTYVVLNYGQKCPLLSAALEP